MSDSITVPYSKKNDKEQDEVKIKLIIKLKLFRTYFLETFGAFQLYSSGAW